MLGLNDICETNELFQRSQKSSQPTRYERKARERESSSNLSKSTTGDRFIPSREALNHDISMHKQSQGNKENSGETSNKAFNDQLAQSLFHGDDLNSKVLAFKEQPKAASDAFQNNLRVLYTQNKAKPAAVKKVARHIASAPERILDAPDLLDDYYLNLLTWSSKNVLAVALGGCVYLWDAASGETDLLCEAKEGDDYVCSVDWMADGSYLAIGMSTGEVQMWDITRKKQVRSMKGHEARVGALSWNNHILSSGSRDSSIFHHDVRVAQHHVGTLKGHQQEICGLKWSPDGTQLASGGNDNVCCIWDVNSANDQSLHTFTECNAAVKALAWCPWEKHTLATGGGTADRHIRFYDTVAGNVVKSIDTGSQVCSITWSTNGEKELLSSHGFSENQLTVWKYNSMVRIKELTGHTSRVLHTALSADGTTVCSAAADETIRFWKVWEAQEKNTTVNNNRRLEEKKRGSRLTMTIR